jgi:putative ABC transport system ATP-binding protein
MSDEPADKKTGDGEKKSNGNGSAAATGKPIIKMRGLRKVYKRGAQDIPVLEGIDLDIGEGAFEALMGPSGSGKTTLLNILGCLDRPTGGAYRLSGRDVARLSDDELARVRNRSIGFVFQSFQLVPQLTVLENVELPLFYEGAPRKTRRARCEELLGSVGMTHRLQSYPTQLSGGECQRVAIARALVNRPALLLADEPTGNLDSKNGAEVMQLFRRLHREGRTIVMVTHNPEIAAELPRVVEMHDGRIVRDGAPEKRPSGVLTPFASPAAVEQGA